jgi:hypothetical protein
MSRASRLDALEADDTGRCPACSGPELAYRRMIDQARIRAGRARPAPCPVCGEMTAAAAVDRPAGDGR